MSIKVVPDFYVRNTVVEVPVVEEYFPGIFSVRTCLYVGIRPQGWGGCESPNSLEQALLKITMEMGAVDGIEIWPPYVKRLRENPPAWLNYLWQRDICDIETRLKISPVRYELVVWWHGPEHAQTPTAGLRALANCEYVCFGKVLLGTPWGKSQNTQWAGFEGEADNPHEAHGWELTPDELDDLGYEVIALNCRRPEEKDRTPCGHLIACREVS